MIEQWQINDGYSDMGISWEWMKSMTSGKATDSIADHKVYEKCVCANKSSTASQFLKTFLMKWVMLRDVIF